MSATSQIEHELAELELSLLNLESEGEEPRKDGREIEQVEDAIFNLRTEVQWQMAEENERGETG